jgi:signal transduction histidine kinase
MFSAVSLLYGAEDIKPSSKTDQYLSVIGQNCHRLLRLSNNISDMVDISAKRAPFYPEIINVVPFVKSITGKASEYAGVLGVAISMKPTIRLFSRE